jgi:peroxiredoxin Q/BCP
MTFDFDFIPGFKNITYKVQPTTCQATSNLEISIPDTQGHNIVLYFYPKDATPGCTTEGQDFRDNHQAFLDANTIIYGVSKPILTMENRPLPIDSFNSVAV